MNCAELLTLVPARGGSSRLPGKNARPLAGRSLLARTAEALKASSWRDSPCLLSTDDPGIRNEGMSFGWRAPWLRPAELATETATMVDVALHALDWWRQEQGCDPGILLLLQPTTPFRDPETIDRAVEMLRSHEELDAVIGASVLHRSPRTIFIEGLSGCISPIGDASEPSRLLTPNGSLYAIRSATLRAARSFFPRQTAAIEMGGIHSIDIDTPEDWLIAEAIAAAMADRG